MHNIGRFVLVAAAQIWALTAVAQHDLGFSIGVFAEHVHERRTGSRAHVRLIGNQPINAVATIYYRRRKNPHVNFACELNLIKRSFDVRYGNGQQAGSVSTVGHVDLNILYLTIAPEIKLINSDNLVFRVGPMIGFRVGGKLEGTYTNSYLYQWQTVNYHNSLPDEIRGGSQLLAGLGYRKAIGERYAISVNLNITTTVYSVIRQNPGVGFTNYGLSLGIARSQFAKRLDGSINSSVLKT